jgi:cytoskeletal protein RodZ
MAVSFGEQLRLAREARGISLKEISEQTRISTQYLEAIEKDEYKKLPGGIFNRSFVKAYARSVGFDENEAIEAYKRIVNEQSDVIDEVQVTPHKYQVLSYDNTRSPLVTALLTGIVLVILSLGIYAALHWYLKRTDPTRSSNQQTNQTTNQTNTTPPQNNSTTPNTNNVNTTVPPPVDTNAFIIQLKAKEDVWVKTINDDEKNASFQNIIPEGQVQELKPQQQVKIVISRDKVNALEVTVNGRAVNVQYQTEAKGAVAIITKDNYQQMLIQ